MFNPIVSKWDKEARAREEKIKKECDILLYVVSPKMDGVYTIAEIVESSFVVPNRTLVVFMPMDEKIVWNREMYNSIMAVFEMVKKRGVRVISDFDDFLEYVELILGIIYAEQFRNK